MSRNRYSIAVVMHNVAGKLRPTVAHAWLQRCLGAWIVLTRPMSRHLGLERTDRLAEDYFGRGS